MTLQAPRGDESEEEQLERVGIKSVTGPHKMEEKEESPLRSIFGNTPQIRMIETLVLHPDCDYDTQELAEISKAPDILAMMAHQALLMDYQIMKETVIKNNVQRYALDKDSPTGKLLNVLAFTLADTSIVLEEEG